MAPPFVQVVFLACYNPLPADTGPPNDTADSSAGTNNADDSSADTDDTDETDDTDDTTWDTGFVKAPCDVPVPLMLDLYQHTSPDDGTTWDAPVWIQSNSSVPDIAWSALVDDGAAWMFWMAFNDRSDQCDALVYSQIDPSTGALTGTTGEVRFRDTPNLTPLEVGYDHPIADPDILFLGDRPVMVVTLWPTSELFPCVGITTGSSPGSLSAGTFDYQEHLLWCDPDDRMAYTDAMALWDPDDPDDPDSAGRIRVWMPSSIAMIDGSVDNRHWIVDVPDPDDPSTWNAIEDASATLQEFHALGSIEHVGEEDCAFGVWGTYDNFVYRACTSDFETWSVVGDATVFAADPVIVPWEGSWYMFVTRDEDYTGEAPTF